MSNVTETASGGRSDAGPSTTDQAKEKVQETAQQVQERVGETAQQVRSQAGERVRQQLDERSTQVGEQVTTTADAIRRVGEQLRQEGKHEPARYADQVAQRAERLGGYLTRADADQMLRDLENFARRQPWLAALGGATVGFLASRFVKASTAAGYQSQFGGNGSGYDPALPRAGGTSPSSRADIGVAVAASYEPTGRAATSGGDPASAGSGPRAGERG